MVSLMTPSSRSYLLAVLWLAVLPLGLASPDFSITPTTWSQREWSLLTTKFLPGHYQSRLHLANGYFGLALSAAGPFWEKEINETDPVGGQTPTNGWPLFQERIAFSTVSGFWNLQTTSPGTNYPWLSQYGSDSFIAGIPHASAILLTFNESSLDGSVSPDHVFDYRQLFSFRTGLAEWSYKWKPAGSNASFLVSFETFVSRSRPNVMAVRATIIPETDAEMMATDLLDGRSATRTTAGSTERKADKNIIKSSVHPEGLENVTAWVVSNADFPGTLVEKTPPDLIPNTPGTNAQTFQLKLKAGKPTVLTKYVGVASSDKFNNPKDTATKAATEAAKTGWDALLAEHKAAWATLLTDASVDNFTDPATGHLPDDLNVQILQIASVANTFYLLSNLRSDEIVGIGDNSVSVGGLASDSYGGQVFWDADTWMAPGLNLAFPKLAVQIPNFRVKLHQQALENAVFNGFPKNSSLYSWTTGRFGNCTATGPCRDYEYHLNYDIVFNMLQLHNILRNQTWFSQGPEKVLLSTAHMTNSLLQFDNRTGTYWIKNATDPDEYANNVDNPVFTLASAGELLVRANHYLAAQGRKRFSQWDKIANAIALPRALSGITKEYETMTNTVVVKQADVALLTYPLGYSHNYSSINKLKDLDYYATKQSANGPAMTYSVYAAAVNSMAISGCAAYSYTLQAVLPYLRAPWYQFSEQIIDDPSRNGGIPPAFPFLTGHGGANQIVPFGFLGVRTDQEVLFLNPSLPPQIPHLRVRTFYFAGAALTASMNATHTTIVRSAPPSGVIDQYAKQDFPLTIGTPDDPAAQTHHLLPENGVLIVPNRLYWFQATYPGNRLQCRPASSKHPHVPGRFPEAAVDGSSATGWQPLNANISSTITIRTSALTPAKINGVYIDFGSRPAEEAFLFIWDETDPIGSGTKVPIAGLGEDFQFTAPSNSGEAVPVVSNTIKMDLSELNHKTKKNIDLVVRGCVKCDYDEGKGATIMEFVIY